MERKPYLQDADFTLWNGDVLETLRELPAESVDCCITSPPYWGLRDYGTGEWEGGDEGCDHTPSGQPRSERPAGRLTGGKATVEAATITRDTCRCGAHRVDQQLGLEATPDEYVARMVEVFREVRRVLAPRGTCWVNLGDSYASGNRMTDDERDAMKERGVRRGYDKGNAFANYADRIDRTPLAPGLKPKDLVGIPWSVAKALQAPYYAGRIRSDRDRTWLAATIDAEGSISGFRHERKDDGRVRTGVHVTITNTSRALLDEAQRIWPTSREDHNAHGDGHYGSLPIWRWIAHGAESKAMLMRELYPHLIVKRTQALLAYNLLLFQMDGKRLGRGIHGAEVRAKRELLTRLLSDANGQRGVDIPSWCVEPPTLYEPGWYLRAEIVWSKANPMPESVTDRPTKAHEQIFLLTKQPRYWFDQEAVRESATWDRWSSKQTTPKHTENGNARYASFGREWTEEELERYRSGGRNVRSVWDIATQPYPEAHFATYPEELVRRCLLAGCPERVCRTCGKPSERIVERPDNPDGIMGRGNGRHLHDFNPAATGVHVDPPATTTLGWSDCGHDDYRAGLVLDPFLGSGTTALVARKHSRHAVGIELNPAYCALVAKRLQQLSLFAEAG